MINEGQVLTIGDELRHILGPEPAASLHLRWPPNIFAACWSLLETSGLYTRVLDSWPRHMKPQEWRKEARDVGADWLQCAIDVLASDSGNAPGAVVRLWEVVLSAQDTPLPSLKESPSVCDALLQLLGYADEASAGFGLPLPANASAADSRTQTFFNEVLLRLLRNESLALGLATSRIRVLPKQHTPRFGITLRSLSHHLAVFTGDEVSPIWSTQMPGDSSLNLLVVPWPFIVRPSQFAPAGRNIESPVDPFACFDYTATSTAELAYEGTFGEWIDALLFNAKRVSGHVHGIIFPEASLTADDFAIVDSVALRHGAFLVAGVSSTREHAGTERGSNEVWMTFGVGEDRLEIKVVQAKHHRWQLDRAQIEMYGLGGTLDPGHRWWESTPVARREVNFIAALNGKFTMCCLICEDLARQDPVSRLVRAVGPNLVVALLADGPQLAQRWPARYATVLADDPGSSVLTVTSLGMVRLAQPPAGKERSRAVALWKDAEGGLKEISLEQDAAAILLNLWAREDTEFSADGRDDGGAACYPTLVGHHSIFVS